jgi:hypothetical protein
MRKLFLLFIVFAVLVLGIISLYNAMTTYSKQLNIKALSLSRINDTLACNRLSSAIRIPIVNNPIDSIFIAAEQKFPEFLREAFPNFHNDPSVSIMGFGSNSLLYRWKGRDNRMKPILLLAETDVKDPDLSKLPQWTYNPFLGKISGGYIWGAGVMDGKAAAIAMLEALEASVNEDKIPQRTLYLALINNKDKNKSHQILADLLLNEGLAFEFVLNSESFLNEGICLGLKRPIAALSTSEKQAISLKMKGYSPEQLKKKLENLTLKKRAVPTRGKIAANLLSTLTPELFFTDRLLFCNPYLFGPLINSRLKNDPLLSEMFDIDMEISKMQGIGTEINWLLPPDTDIKSFKEMIKEEFKDIDLVWEEPKEKRKSSSSAGFAYEAMQTSIRQALGDVIVIPAIKTEPGKTVYYSRLSSALLDFRPWTFDQAEIERLNSGVDQRLQLKQYLRGVDFYRILFKNTLF